MLLLGGVHWANGDETFGGSGPPTTSDVPEGKRRQAHSLEFVSVSYMPSPMKAGDTMQVGAVVRNDGLVATGGSGFRVKISCTKVVGGSCPIGPADAPINLLQPGGTQSFTLISNKQAVPGIYRVGVWIWDPQDKYLDRRYIDFTVPQPPPADPKLKIKPGALRKRK